ncbi:hypothetical protein M8C21_004229, partial [Ambrosia artemisiifolia]
SAGCGGFAAAYYTLHPRQKANEHGGLPPVVAGGVVSSCRINLGLSFPLVQDVFPGINYLSIIFSIVSVTAEHRSQTATLSKAFDTITLCKVIANERGMKRWWAVPERCGVKLQVRSEIDG